MNDVKQGRPSRGSAWRVAAWPLAVGLALRVTLGVIGLYVPLHDSTGDALQFHATAAEWSTAGFAGVLAHFTLGSGLYSFFLALAYVLLGPHISVAVGLNVILGTLVVMNTYLISRELWGERVGRRAAWLAALWPTVALYSVLVLREEAFIYPLTVGIFFLARWATTRKARWLSLAAAAIGVAAWFHRGAVPALAVLVLVAVAGGVRAAKRHGLAAARPFAVAAVGAVVVSGLFVAPLIGVANLQNHLPQWLGGGPPVAIAGAHAAFASAGPLAQTHMAAAQAEPQLKSGDFGSDLARRNDLSTGARSAYLSWLPERNLIDATWQAPIRVTYFLFAPMPWAITQMQDVIGFVDGLLYLAVAVALWRGRRELAKQPAALAVLAMCLVLLVVFADNTFNAGTAVRHRAKFAPILLALIPAGAAPFFDRPLKILHVVNAPASFLQNRLPIAVAAQAAGHEVKVVGPPGPQVADVRALGFTYLEVALDRKGTNPAAEMSTMLSLARLYRRERPDLVHHFTIKPVVYGGIAARLARVPMAVHTITGLGYVYTSRDAKARVLRPIVSLAYTFAFDHPNARIVAQNADDAELLHASGALLESTLIEGSGVDVVRFAPSPEPEGRVTVVLPSRMLADKGVVEFVEAARTLRGTGARFALVGDTDAGNPAAIPLSQLETWAKAGDVEWWGWQDDMATIYRDAHVVCLPSYREGLPKTLLEAGACGRAIVTTDVPGCRAVVANGRTGLLVPARDSAALAGALRQVIADPILRARLGTAARAEVEARFSDRRIAEEYLRLYDRLAREPARAA